MAESVSELKRMLCSALVKLPGHHLHGIEGASEFLKENLEGGILKMTQKFLKKLNEDGCVVDMKALAHFCSEVDHKFTIMRIRMMDIDD